jgi:hypothetical protein
VHPILVLHHCGAKNVLRMKPKMADNVDFMDNLSFGRQTFTWPVLARSLQ